jgi:ribosome-associated toxin RatA of RatAB toxin-antitoxin module
MSGTRSASEGDGPSPTRRGARLCGPWLLAMLALALLPCARAADPAQVQVERAGATVVVAAAAQVEAPAQVCFDVLADFDHLGDFVPSMKSSRVISDPGAPLQVRQEGVAKAGPFSIRVDVTLAVTLDPPREIAFRRVAGNVKQMHGSWRVDGDATTCRIGYEADIEPAFWVPPLIGPRLMRSQVEEQLGGVVKEIRRRRGTHER